MNFQEYNKIAKEFFDNVKTLNIEELDNAYKCLGIEYLTMKGTGNEVYQASIVLRLAGRAKIERELIIENC